MPQEYETKSALIKCVSDELTGHRKTSFNLMSREDQVEIAVIMLAKGTISFSVIKGSPSPCPVPEQPVEYPWTNSTRLAR